MSTANGWDATAQAIAAQELERIKAQDEEFENLKEIARTALRVREAQKNYFTARKLGYSATNDLLRESKQAERELDDLLAAWQTPKPAGAQARLI